MSSLIIWNLLFLFLLVSHALPVTEAQTRTTRALIAAAGLSLITSNYAGVTEWSAPQLVTIALITAILLRRQSFYCDDYPTFTFDTTYDICYKIYKDPKLTVQGTDAVCKAHGTRSQLIRINSPTIYDFVVKQMDQNGISNIYFQGKRVSSSAPFLYDDGTPVTYFNWVPGEPASDLYLRTDTSTKLMETSDGSTERSFICAVYP
ncbi:uncharacterized protein LOC133186413 [Saccostrea echinata]|uniref:uncharacterized protein LOC133186413 n=1 Tax=Saccostrea echinata TaxID=191078 RepID=UPI002A81BE1D|nr:uncharacterized protein LOC133186413 [Saccostrea echinata]